MSCDRGCWRGRHRFEEAPPGCACAFAHGGSDPLDRSSPHITGCEDPGQAGLERQCGATMGSAFNGAGARASSAAARRTPR
jgi:hypothetical protein